MRIAILAVGQKPPEWVRAGFEEYRKRLPKPYAPELIELAAGTRGSGRDPARAISDEGARVLAALPKGEWMRLGVQLKCLRVAGADTGKLDMPLVLRGSDGVTLALSKVVASTDFDRKLDCPIR